MLSPATLAALFRFLRRENPEALSILKPSYLCSKVAVCATAGIPVVWFTARFLM